MAKRSEERPDHNGSAAGIVVPLRSFVHAKARLAHVLNDDARAALVRDMADRVARAARPHPTVVVSNAAEVIAWAATHDIAVIADPGTLDGAAAAGRAWVRAQGLDRVVVVHADLPFATSLAPLTDPAGAAAAVVVPDRRNDGTPALSVPAAAEFAFAYGPGSAARHIAAARACGLDVRVVRDEQLGFDVDTAADLEELVARRAASSNAPVR